MENRTEGAGHVGIERAHPAGAGGVYEREVGRGSRVHARRVLQERDLSRAGRREPDASTRSLE
jgi:hypothetical protein